MSRMLTEEDWQRQQGAEAIRERYRRLLGGSKAPELPPAPTAIAFDGGCCLSWLTFQHPEEAATALEGLTQTGAGLWEGATLQRFQRTSPWGSEQYDPESGERLRSYNACPRHRENGTERTEL